MKTPTEAWPYRLSRALRKTKVWQTLLAVIGTLLFLSAVLPLLLQMPKGTLKQAAQPSLDIVRHPTLGELKFPKDMPYSERNRIIENFLARHQIRNPTALASQTISPQTQGTSVNIPNIGTVNFPGSMSQEDIIKAIENEIIPQHTLSQPFYRHPIQQVEAMIQHPAIAWHEAWTWSPLYRPPLFVYYKLGQAAIAILVIAFAIWGTWPFRLGSALLRDEMKTWHKQLAIVGVLFFLWTVWPTQYRYDYWGWDLEHSVSVKMDHPIGRTSRITGEKEFHNPTWGWWQFATSEDRIVKTPPVSRNLQAAGVLVLLAAGLGVIVLRKE